MVGSSQGLPISSCSTQRTATVFTPHISRSPPRGPISRLSPGLLIPQAEYLVCLTAVPFSAFIVVEPAATSPRFARTVLPRLGAQSPSRIQPRGPAIGKAPFRDTFVLPGNVQVYLRGTCKAGIYLSHARNWSYWPFFFCVSRTTSSSLGLSVSSSRLGAQSRLLSLQLGLLDLTCIQLFHLSSSTHAASCSIQG